MSHPNIWPTHHRLHQHTLGGGQYCTAGRNQSCHQNTRKSSADLTYLCNFLKFQQSPLFILLVVMMKNSNRKMCIPLGNPRCQFPAQHLTHTSYRYSYFIVSDFSYCFLG